jgi:hypothetical protein
VLETKLSLRETLRLLSSVEKPVMSRFWFGSPCRFVRQVDVLTHIVVPELLEGRLPRLAKYLRRTSPRWGRSWRNWSSETLGPDVEARQVD